MQEFKDRMKVMAFFREFPYLYGITKPEVIQEVKVRRWDDHLLNLWTIEYGEDYVSKRNTIYLLDEHYQVVAVAGRFPERKISWWNPFGWGEATRHEQVLDSILKLGELASSVKHVVGIHSGFAERTVAIIYKAPSGVSNLKSWTDEYMARAQEEVAACVTATGTLA